MFNTISFTGTFITLKGEKIKDLFQPKYCFTQAEKENQMPKLSLSYKEKSDLFQPKYCFTQSETENQMPKLSLLYKEKRRSMFIISIKLFM
jgi:hypothetical protein